jgi:hypothetical protein
LVVAVVVQRDALTSVWCFFAAILSSVVLIAVDRLQRSQPVSPAAHPAPAAP